MRSINVWVFFNVYVKYTCRTTVVMLYLHFNSTLSKLYICT